MLSEDAPSKDENFASQCQMSCVLSTLNPLPFDMQALHHTLSFISLCQTKVHSFPQVPFIDSHFSHSLVHKASNT